MFGKQTLLIVDDSENDREFMRVAFKEANFNWPMQELHDGADAIAYLKGDGPYGDRNKFLLPAVMLLDLNMPKKNGFEVLQWVRAQEQFKHFQIIVLTASPLLEDVKQAYCLGANSFLIKPLALKDLVTLVGCLRDWLQIIRVAPLD